ncbi:MAG: late competence development ComFB family protein [Spongiibacteraceae bacterium]|nr:late competence development ComFB family protein [Spongiibacteraceae bacterium]
MLLTTGNRPDNLSSALDSIHNYYEHLVIEEVHNVLTGKLDNNNYIADIACVALNHLPPRYIRHDVDMAFYLSPNERLEILTKVEKAVADAIGIVDTSDKRYDTA